MIYFLTTKTVLCVRALQCVTNIHVIHGAQHVVVRARQAADAQTAVRALIARVSSEQEK